MFIFRSDAHKTRLSHPQSAATCASPAGDGGGSSALLAESGNVRVACALSGVGLGCVYRLRRTEPGFVALMAAAVAEADGLLGNSEAEEAFTASTSSPSPRLRLRRNYRGTWSSAADRRAIVGRGRRADRRTARHRCGVSGHSRVTADLRVPSVRAAGSPKRRPTTGASGCRASRGPWTRRCPRPGGGSRRGRPPRRWTRRDAGARRLRAGGPDDVRRRPAIRMVQALARRARAAGPRRQAVTGRLPSLQPAQRRARDAFSATAARTSAFNAASSIVSPSRMSMARRALPSRLALNRLEGPSSAAPLAKVSLTTFL